MDWDVETFKTEHECDEHWQLRRMFLLKHRDKFPEDRLICLAQVFINMEILGCRYPEETMKLVNSLSEGIVESFREKRKSKLQRTFVQASDAAESKAKGTKRPFDVQRNAAEAATKYSKTISFERASDSPSQAVPGPSSVVTHLKMDIVESASCKTSSTESTSTTQLQLSRGIGFRRVAGIHSPNVKAGDMIPIKPLAAHRVKKPEPVPYKFNKDSTSTSVKNPEPVPYIFNKDSLQQRDISNLSTAGNPFGNLIIVENSFHEPLASATIQRSLLLSGMSVENLFKCTTLPDGNISCDLCVNGNIVGTGKGATRVLAKEAVAEVVLLQMKEFCYTIEVKANYISETTIDKSFQGKTKSSSEQALTDDNLGNKLLRLMGWSGGGLGKNSQGIEAPVTAAEHVNRAGLGLKNLNIHQSKHKIRKVFDSFIANDSGYDLAFSSDFTKEERAAIHLIARQCHLKTKSHGIGEDRHIVASKKERPQDILRRLIQSGGSTEKYNLIKPKRLM